MKRTLQFCLVLLYLVGFSLIGALAAGNTVPVSHVAVRTVPVTIMQLAPTECAALNLTSMLLATPGKDVSGTNASELILAAYGKTTVHGGKGDDCIVGGYAPAGQANDLQGQEGNDVIIGGPGSDKIDGGGGGGGFFDYCYGTSGVDTFNNCESIIYR